MEDEQRNDGEWADLGPVETDAEKPRARKVRIRPGELPERYISSSGVDLRQHRIDFDAPWESDPTCRLLVAMHPQGMTLEEIGIVAWAGNRRRTSTDPRRIRQQKDVEPRPLTRERIRQIEASALRKLRRDDDEGERRV